MSEPIYIVSGFPRSGTSMMMRAIEAGGIPCVYKTEGDANRNRNTLIPGYVPNPHGFYEDAPLRGDWSTFRGKAVKVIRDNFHEMPSAEHFKVVYMRRDPAEIRRSYIGILSGPYGEDAFRFLNGYHAKVESDLARFVDVTVLDYADVVANPSRELARLDWPINVAKAASTVDPSLYRNRGAA